MALMRMILSQSMTEAWTSNQPIRDKECLNLTRNDVMDQILIMITAGFIGIVIYGAAFMYILRNWNYLFETNGNFALGFGLIMCGISTGVSALSLIFGIAKLFS